MFSGIVYKVSNKIDGKIYIGQTSRLLEDRWREHCHDAKYNTRPGSRLHKAIREQGEDKFLIEVLAFAKTKQELDTLETEYILFNNSLSHDRGYNLALGGAHGGARTFRLADRIQALANEEFTASEIAEILSVTIKQVLRSAEDFELDVPENFYSREFEESAKTQADRAYWERYTEEFVLQDPRKREFLLVH